MTASPYGLHRAVQPARQLPYSAQKLDASLPLQANEYLIEVDALNLDSASFHQLWKANDGDSLAMAEAIRQIVSDRGKMHNPVTGSGGVLVGRVAQVGDALRDRGLAVGDRLVTLISLTTTPLALTEIGEIRPDSHQIPVKGQAILFEKSLWAKVPDDLPEPLVMTALDVCGAPAQAQRLVNPDDRVVILGAGKSGILCAYVALKQVRSPKQVLVMDYSQIAVEKLAILDPSGQMGLKQVDATNAVGVMELVSEWTNGQMANLVINCVNVPNTEMGSILSVGDRGKVYFFSMATSFTAAALGAESVGQDIDLLIGNGYARGHADLTLDLLRESSELRQLLSAEK